jgi:hypothetical protein
MGMGIIMSRWHMILWHIGRMVQLDTIVMIGFWRRSEKNVTVPCSLIISHDQTSMVLHLRLSFMCLMRIFVSEDGRLQVTVNLFTVVPGWSL